jgi:hypothetical protein
MLIPESVGPLVGACIPRPLDSSRVFLYICLLTNSPTESFHSRVGRERSDKFSVEELLNLELLLRHVAVLQKKLKMRQNLSEDLREVTIALAITYEQIEAELLQQGAEMRSRAIALEMLRMGMAPEEVARITQLRIAQLPSLKD